VSIFNLIEKKSLQNIDKPKKSSTSLFSLFRKVLKHEKLSKEELKIIDINRFIFIKYLSCDRRLVNTILSIENSDIEVFVYIIQKELKKFNIRYIKWIK